MNGMTADQHMAKAAKLQRKARHHGGLFGRGTRKRMLMEAQNHILAAQQLTAQGQPPGLPWNQ